MSYTKGQIIADAFAEIGLGPYYYDMQPEDREGALRRLNALMAQWASEGAALGWPLVNTPGADDLDADSALPADAVHGVVCALAEALAPSYGKQVSPTTVKAAVAGKRIMQAKGFSVPSMAMNTAAVPAGAGQTPTHSFLSEE